MSLGLTTSDISRSAGWSLSRMETVASWLTPGTTPAGRLPKRSLRLSPSSSISSSTATKAIVFSVTPLPNITLSGTPE